MEWNFKNLWISYSSTNSHSVGPIIYYIILYPIYIQNFSLVSYMSCFLWIMMQTRFTHFISFWCLLNFFSSVTAHFLLSSHLFSFHIFYWVSCTVEWSFPCVIFNLIFCFPYKLTYWWTVNWSWGLETWLNSISYFLKAYTS